MTQQCAALTIIITYLKQETTALSNRYVASFELIKKVTLEKLRKSQAEKSRLRERLGEEKGLRNKLQAENTALKEVRQ